MPHRFNSMPMPSTQRQEESRESSQIAAPRLSSPTGGYPRLPPTSPSLDRSSMPRSAPLRRNSGNSPLHASPHQSPPTHQNQTQMSVPHAGHHFSTRPQHTSHHFSHNSPSTYESGGYESHDHTPYHSHAEGQQYGAPSISHGPMGNVRDNYGAMYPLPGQSGVSIVHTDDAATKLSDRVRRRCFNCCTTDTSTWRRSNLSPGKVLCNKCGLFERTHSRARPEQFPHKRGPLASTSLQSRSPAPNPLPPISPAPQTLPPYHHHHPSIAPLSSVPDSRRHYHANALPEIQSWLNESPEKSSPTPPGSGRNFEASEGGGGPTPPHIGTNRNRDSMSSGEPSA